MTADNDVNSVFERNTIKEIETLLSKMRNDIERKKEDLRIMVGERYRDLIEAADTISDMKESTKCVCKNIETMEGLCESLQQRGLIGFKTRMSSVSDHSRIHTSGHQYSLAIQVKLLVDVPEILWGLTENKEYLDAAQLLLLSQQAHTALQLSPNANEMLDKFPVISRQWSNISQFRSTITKGCVSLIQNEVKDCQLVLTAVCAMMLLEGYDLLESLRKVLDLRRSSLTSVLEVKPSTIAKTQLVNFTLFFISSVKILHYLFVGEGGGKCRLERRLNEICGVSSEAEGEGGEAIPTPQPPISLLHESSLGLSFLPKSVVEFRPSLRVRLERLPPSHVQAEMRNWLAAVSSHAAKDIHKLLSCTTSIKALSLIRASVWEAEEAETESEDAWVEMTRALLGGAPSSSPAPAPAPAPSLSPWTSIVRSEALARARLLVTKELHATAESLVHLVKSLANEIHSNAKVCREEGDVSAFLWSESPSDLPGQAAWASFAASHAAPGANNDKMGLFYKSRGYTKRVRSICRSLNSRLLLILEDVANYAPPHSQLHNNDPVAEAASLAGGVERGGAHADYEALLQFLEKETLAVFKGFLHQLEDLALSHLKQCDDALSAPCDPGEEDAPGEECPAVPLPGTTVLVSVGRLCQAVPAVCQQLKICAGASLLADRDMARRISLGLPPDTPTWLSVSGSFSSLNTSLLSAFFSFATRLFARRLKDQLHAATGRDTHHLLLLFPSWEKIVIDEEVDGGSVVASSISVPAHPSPPLAAMLRRVSAAVNAVCAHTVSRAAQGVLVRSLCSEVLSVYGALACPEREGGAALNQAASLQLIFDLKLMQNLLLPRENKVLWERASDVIARMESNVDPFDLDVFAPHLSANVKVASQRLLILLGTLIPREKQPLTSKGSPSSPSSTNALNVVPSVDIPRFSNVPVAASARKAGGGALLQGRPLETHFQSCLDVPSQQSRDPTTATPMTSSRSVGSSIFSAMSSSWFGGGAS